MNTVAHQPVQNGLATEWHRIELLAHCLTLTRHGRDVSEDLLQQLRDAHDAVTTARDHNAWSTLAGVALQPLEYDVLACVAAPEAEPRFGWLYQTLQPGAPQPYPTPALMQELFALDGGEVSALYDVLGEDGRLRRAGLLANEGPAPFQPVRLADGTSARLFGRTHTQPTPPGAVRVRSAATWDDLVLPGDRVRMLRELLAWVRHRDIVVNQWGGGDCGGPIALFSGPSGTGKTLAASVLANDLQWPLFRVDLGRLISKYIGETEQNLNRLFDAAHGQPMMLQFDEADSVFGKRGEIKEARDRYANMEVSHLLARIESHAGPCILTTNLRGNLDPAFARRFQIVVEFTRPNAAARQLLWRRLLPPRAPGVGDLDLELIARAVGLTGGGIRNAALHAAYLAAAQSRPIALPQIALAAWREIAKDGREVSTGDLGELAKYLDDGRHTTMENQR